MGRGEGGVPELLGEFPALFSLIYPRANAAFPAQHPAAEMLREGLPACRAALQTDPGTAVLLKVPASFQCPFSRAGKQEVFPVFLGVLSRGLVPPPAPQVGLCPCVGQL